MDFFRPGKLDAMLQFFKKSPDNPQMIKYHINLLYVVEELNVVYL